MSSMLHASVAAFAVLSGTWTVRFGWKGRFASLDKLFEFVVCLLFVIVGAMARERNVVPDFLLILSFCLAVRTGWAYYRAIYGTASFEIWYAVSYFILAIAGRTFLQGNRVGTCCLLWSLSIPIYFLNRIYIPTKRSRDAEDAKQ
jgi:hypothetical protein